MHDHSFVRDRIIPSDLGDLSDDVFIKYLEGQLFTISERQKYAVNKAEVI